MSQDAVSMAMGIMHMDEIGLNVPDQPDQLTNNPGAQIGFAIGMDLE